MARTCRTISLPLLSVIVAPEIFSEPVPLFSSVICCAALLVPWVWLPKVSEVGVSVALGTGVAVPVPVREAVCGEFDASSVTLSLPGSEPMLVGVNVTAMVQLAPAVSVVPQVVVAE